MGRIPVPSASQECTLKIEWIDTLGQITKAVENVMATDRINKVSNSQFKKDRNDNIKKNDDGKEIRPGSREGGNFYTFYQNHCVWAKD